MIDKKDEMCSKQDVNINITHIVHKTKNFISHKELEVEKLKKEK